ncbi:hypothetical protein C8J57DRAFT_1661082 [Mycena rebaudengoi]|nr:hypothetical protein C8J57DRAFT_1661082 [Mycena rebaudengoi]
MPQTFQQLQSDFKNELCLLEKRAWISALNQPVMRQWIQRYGVWVKSPWLRRSATRGTRAGQVETSGLESWRKQHGAGTNRHVCGVHSRAGKRTLSMWTSSDSAGAGQATLSTQSDNSKRWIASSARQHPTPEAERGAREWSGRSRRRERRSEERKEKEISCMQCIETARSGGSGHRSRHEWHTRKGLRQIEGSQHWRCRWMQRCGETTRGGLRAAQDSTRHVRNGGLMNEAEDANRRSEKLTMRKDKERGESGKRAGTNGVRCERFMGRDENSVKHEHEGLRIWRKGWPCSSRRRRKPATGRENFLKERDSKAACGEEARRSGPRCRVWRRQVHKYCFGNDALEARILGFKCENALERRGECVERRVLGAKYGRRLREGKNVQSDSSLSIGGEYCRFPSLLLGVKGRGYARQELVLMSIIGAVLTVKAEIHYVIHDSLPFAEGTGGQFKALEPPHIVEQLPPQVAVMAVVENEQEGVFMKQINTLGPDVRYVERHEIKPQRDAKAVVKLVMKSLIFLDGTQTRDARVRQRIAEVKAERYLMDEGSNHSEEGQEALGD